MIFKKLEQMMAKKIVTEHRNRCQKSIFTTFKKLSLIIICENFKKRVKLQR